MDSSNKNTISIVFLLMVALLSTTKTFTEAQQIPSCASKLVTCYNFINSTTAPDKTCCDSIKQVVTNELPCLCTLYNTPSLLATFNVTIDDAVRLTKDCDVPSDLSACNAVTVPSPTSGGTAGGGDSGGAGRIGVAWTGLSSLVLIWVSIMLY